MIKLTRTGKRPLEFEGEKITSASSKTTSGPGQNRWWEIAAYETTTKKIVVSVIYRTIWDGEHDVHDAVVCDSVQDAATMLENYIPQNMDGVGYPASPAYAERQARLLVDIDASLKRTITEILSDLPGSAEKI